MSSQVCDGIFGSLFALVSCRCKCDFYIAAIAVCDARVSFGELTRGCDVSLLSVELREEVRESGKVGVTL